MSDIKRCGVCGVPKPSFDKTYRRADKELIVDYGWVTDLDVFEDDEYPTELIEETWERTSVRVFWNLPEVLYDCDSGECEEDAVAWWQSPDGPWLQLCQEHLEQKS